MKKTANDMEIKIVKRILEGDAYAVISADTGVAVSTIKKIKKRNYESFALSTLASTFTTYEEINSIIRRTNKQLIRRLDAYEDDMSVRELLAILHYANKQTAIYSPLTQHLRIPRYLQK